MLFSGHKQFNLYRKLSGFNVGYLDPTFNKKDNTKKTGESGASTQQDQRVSGAKLFMKPRHDAARLFF